jgi:hypothetical protein
LRDEAFNEVLTGSALTESHACARHTFDGVKGRRAMADSLSYLVLGDIHTSAYYNFV